MRDTGIYIHIPFCNSKCPYCDFYSSVNAKSAEDYCLAAVKTLQEYSGRLKDRVITSVYFGGGTPSAINPELLAGILNRVKSVYSLSHDAEITCEMNPESTTRRKLDVLIESGVNRISFGLQSANENELELLGRQHTAADAERAVKDAKSAGCDNISLDLMLGLPLQTTESLYRSIDFCAALEVQHLSAYILKVEPNTVFGKKHIENSLPDDDTVGDMYLAAVERLAQNGLFQYEISNFSRKGFESRHNLLYWRLCEYLGVGASAYSFLFGERFHYGRSINDFISSSPYISDGKGGDAEEYIMLRLRLTEGLDTEKLKERFGYSFNDKQKEEINAMLSAGLCRFKDGVLSLCPSGMLVSNDIIARLLYDGEI